MILVLAMSVYTPLNSQEIDALIGRYDLGKMLSYQGITAGVTNTNYHVTTDKQQLILILFEQQTHEAIQFYVALSVYLRHHDYPCPEIYCDSQGEAIQTVHGKPAIFLQFIVGEHIKNPKIAHQDAVAGNLAQWHSLTNAFARRKANYRGFDWCQEISADILPELSSIQRQLLIDELEFQKKIPYDNLSKGVIHADLFRDNVLFREDKIVGVIDFDFACYDTWLLDIAIAIGEWCVGENDLPDVKRIRRFVDVYRGHHALSEDEMALLPAICRRATLRFWLSRLWDATHAPKNDNVQIKDPYQMQQLLLFYKRHDQL